MTDPVQLPAQERVYGSFASMLRKYDRYARQDAFRGSTPRNSGNGGRYPKPPAFPVGNM